MKLPIQTEAEGVRFFGVLLWGLLLPVCADGATPDSLRYSADVTVDLAAVRVDDEVPAEDNLGGTVTALTTAITPTSTDLDAYHLLASGDELFSFDTTVVLPGNVTVGPGDVVRFDGVSYIVEFSASDHSLPPSLNLNGVSVIDDGDLIVSFDTSFDLAGQVTDDEDLVRCTGSMLSLFFDGGAEGGVAPELAIDAVHHVDSNGHLLLSFDGSGTVGGMSFDDEDVLEFDPTGGSWSLLYDGSAEHSGWATADLDALHATFPPTTAVLTVMHTGTGSGTVTSQPTGIQCGTTCAFEFDLGVPVMLTAEAGANSVFAGWSGDPDCTDGTVTLGADLTCVAEFNVDPAFEIFSDDFESGNLSAWSP